MSATDLAGRSILVTGGSAGIGLAVCERLAADGARVVMVARDPGRLDEALAGLPGDGHAAVPMDVADAGRWREAVAAVAPDGVLHGLVTAAAVLDPIGPAAEVDPEAVLHTIKVDLWGTFLAIHHCLPALVAAGDGAVVTFSGGGATGPLPRYDAYAAAKAAVVRLTENVAADEPRVRLNAVAPGFVATGIHEATLQAGEQRAGREYLEKTRRQLREGGADLGAAAELVARLLGSEAAGVSGKLISAPWDDWGNPEFRRRLAEDPDYCTLRRIDGTFFGPLDGPG